MDKDESRAQPRSEKQKEKPGEQPPGKFHYNPGNMAGKTVNDTTPPDGERTNTDDTDATDKRPDRTKPA